MNLAAAGKPSLRIFWRIKTEFGGLTTKLLYLLSTEHAHPQTHIGELFTLFLSGIANFNFSAI